MNRPYFSLSFACISLAFAACSAPVAPPEDAAQDHVAIDSARDSSAMDAEPDAAPSMDAAVDAAPDSLPDSAPDSLPDSAPDALPDATADVSTDTGCRAVCDGRCTDTATDPQHCGGCNRVCPAPTNGVAVCDLAACAVRCDPGFYPVGTRCQPLPAPRAIAPLSGRWVSSARPTLRWALNAPADGARVEVCRDAACTVVVQSVDAMGTSVRPTALASGVYFWRLRAMQGTNVGTSASPAWTLVVPARPHATLDIAAHQQFDADNDGSPDALVLASEDPVNMPPEAHIVYVRSGRLVQGAAPIRREAGVRRPIAAGDVNGDGHSDALVPTSGAGCLYYGGATGLTLDACASATAGGLSLAYSASANAGDINGDGYADVIVPGDHGTAFVRYGSTAGLSAPRDEFNRPLDAGISIARMAIADFDGNGSPDVALFRTNGSGVANPVVIPVVGGVPSDAGRRTLTWNLAGFLPWIEINPVASDVNGDGYPDLVVALRSNNFPRTGGRLAVWFGSATGLASAASQIITNPDGGDDLFGDGFDRAGDLDGDGFEDVIVSSRYFNSRAGRVYVYRGGATGLSATPSQSLTGAASNDYFGSALAGLGPVDRRTQLGVLVGAWGANARRGAISLFVTGGAPLINTAAETATTATGTPGYGYAMSSLGH